MRAVLCENSGTATDATTTQRPSGIINPKAKSNLPSRKRHKTVQSHIERAVIALAKEHGGKFPPDDMSVSERDRLITEWLGGDDDPVKPGERTLREYFSQKRD